MLLSDWLDGWEGQVARRRMSLLPRKGARRRSYDAVWVVSPIAELLEDRFLLTLFDLNNAPNAVSEGAPNDSPVGIQVSTTAPGAAMYSLVPGQDAVGRFAIDPVSGVVTARNGNRLNFEITTQHRITVRADYQPSGTFETFSFDIAVNDMIEPAEGVISGIVFNDLNGDGIRQNIPGLPPMIEPELDGRQVILLNSLGEVVRTAHSYSEDRDLDGVVNRLTEQGFYAFGDLPIGLYTVRLVSKLGSRLTTTSTTTSTNSQTATLDINSPPIVSVFDFGLTADMTMVTIKGQVWDDLNNDGTRDTLGEPGVNMQTVELRDQFNNLIASTITQDIDFDGTFGIDQFNERGLYSFGSVPQDSYRVVLVPNGFRRTTFPGGTTSGETINIAHLVTESETSLPGTLNLDFGSHLDLPPGTPIDTDSSPNRIQVGAPDGSRVGVFLKSFDPDGGEPAFYKLTNDAGGLFTVDRHSGMVTVTRGRLIDPLVSTYTIAAVASSPSGNMSPTSTIPITVIQNRPADPPFISVFGMPNGVVEGNFGARFVPVRVTLNKPSDQPITVEFATTSSDALFDLAGVLPMNRAVSNPTERDYYPVTKPPAPGSGAPPEPLILTFAPGQIEQIVRVQIAPEELREQDEFFFVELADPSTNATLSLTQKFDAVKILDDDTAPYILVSSPAVIEGDVPGSRELVFTAEIFGVLPQRTRNSAGGGHFGSTSVASFTVEYMTGNNAVDTAKGGEDESDPTRVDYQSVSGFVTFTETHRLKEIRVPIRSDLIALHDASSETLTLVFFTERPDAVQSPDFRFFDAIGTIVDDDSPNVTLAINSAVIKESDANGQLVELKVAKLGKTTETVTVGFRTEEVVPLEFRAISGLDFQANTGTLSFGPNEVERSIFIRVLGDRVFESNEEFLVQLETPVNAALDPDHRVGRVTILSNDKAIIPDEGDAVANDIASQLTEALANAGGNKNDSEVVRLLRLLSVQVVRDLNLRNALVFIIDPVDFLVSDPQGRRVGYTESTGTVNEIPGAYYSGNGAVELIVLPVSAEASYNVQLTGLGGDYNYAATVVSDGQATTTIFNGSLADGSTPPATAIEVDLSNAIPVGLALAIRGNDSDSATASLSGDSNSLTYSAEVASVLAQFNSNLNDADWFNSSSTTTTRDQWQGFWQSARVTRERFLRNLFNSLSPELGELFNGQQDSPLGMTPEMMDLFWQRLGQSLTGVPASVYRLGELLESLLPTTDSEGDSTKGRNGTENGGDNNGTPRNRRRPTERSRSTPRSTPGQTPKSSTRPANNSSSKTAPQEQKQIASPSKLTDTLWRWLASEPARPTSVPVTKTNS